MVVDFPWRKKYSVEGAQKGSSHMSSAVPSGCLPSGLEDSTIKLISPRLLCSCLFPERAALKRHIEAARPVCYAFGWDVNIFWNRESGFVCNCHVMVEMSTTAFSWQATTCAVISSMHSPHSKPSFTLYTHFSASTCPFQRCELFSWTSPELAKGDCVHESSSLSC